MGELTITTPEVVEKSYKIPEYVPITDELLRVQFRHAWENAGTLECYKADVIGHTLRTMTIAKWSLDKDTGEQLWQVWLDTFDLCKIKYMEQLGALIVGMNLKQLRSK